MFGLHFNPFKSKTVQGALIAAGTYVYAHIEPGHLSPVLQTAFQAIGFLWSVIGHRDAIAKGS